MKVMIRDAVPDDAAGIARVHVDSWKSTYRGIVPDEVLDGLSYQRQEEQRHWIFQNQLSEAFTLVAEDDGGTIVGFADAGPERTEDPDYRSEIYAIYLRREAQGHGVGRQLFEEVVRRVHQSGLDFILIWVLEDNPSRGFYEHMGGRPVRTQTVTIGQELTEIGYGWDVQLSVREGPGD